MAISRGSFVAMLCMFAGAAGVAAWIGDRLATRVEAELTAKLVTALDAGGFAWVRLDVDG